MNLRIGVRDMKGPTLGGSLSGARGRGGAEPGRARHERSEWHAQIKAKSGQRVDLAFLCLQRGDTIDLLGSDVFREAVAVVVKGFCFARIADVADAFAGEE